MTEAVRENASVLQLHGGSPIGNSRVKLTNVEDCVKRGLVVEGENPLHRAAEQLMMDQVTILHTIGGDDTATSALAITRAGGGAIQVAHVPKTIDNDISYCSKTFGFETAFSKAVEAVQSAHVEAYGAHDGVVVIKLMGRDSGFIAANTSLACPDVNFVLIPEVRFDLHGPEGMMAAMENSFDEKQKKGQHPHSVIVVAEGTGQYLMSNKIEKRDPSGNIRYRDIGLFLKESIQKHFEGKVAVIG